jgi:hypothetical protein
MPALHANDRQQMADFDDHDLDRRFAESAHGLPDPVIRRDQLRQRRDHLNRKRRWTLVGSIVGVTITIGAAGSGALAGGTHTDGSPVVGVSTSPSVSRPSSPAPKPSSARPTLTTPAAASDASPTSTTSPVQPSTSGGPVSPPAWLPTAAPETSCPPGKQTMTTVAFSHGQGGGATTPQLLIQSLGYTGTLLRISSAGAYQTLTENVAGRVIATLTLLQGKDKSWTLDQITVPGRATADTRRSRGSTLAALVPDWSWGTRAAARAQ